jgi:hypothetical protein
MMKKTALLLCLFAITAINGYAKQRTQAEALTIAKSFYAGTFNLRNAGAELSLAYAATDDAAALRSANNKTYYYIYNQGDVDFVIVSGDDRAIDILGYSDESAFDYENAPDNLKYWLNCYKKEIESLLSQPETTIAQIVIPNSKTTKNTTTFAPEVRPLLGEIKWNQDAPYNYSCPQGAVTGCVATGMVQVMKYYNWPDRGAGSNTYKPDNYPQISIAFSTTYDWADMLPSYGTSYTPAQRDAVAKLMYHCGVAVNMNYNTAQNGGSGASVYNMGMAMVDHFKYDKGM